MAIHEMSSYIFDATGQQTGFPNRCPVYAGHFVPIPLVEVVMKRFALAVPALLCLASVARAEPMIQPDQYATIHEGESARDIVAQFGRPEFQPHWANGTYSLAYETQASEGVGHAQVYVDVDAATHKVLGYEVVNQE